MASMVAASFFRYPFIIFLPRIQISPIPFSSGLNIFISEPYMAYPAATKLNLSKFCIVMPLVVSLSPYALNKGISKEAK